MKADPIRPSGLRGKLLAYFHANPDEELTISDIVTKFEASPRNVESTLYRMRRLGELEPVPVYRLKVHK